MFQPRKQNTPRGADAHQSTSKMRYARLILQLYHADSANTTKTIDQFVAEYSQDLEITSNHRSKLKQQLQIGEYNYLKQGLDALTRQYETNLQRLQQLNESRYKPIKEIIAKKQHTCLQNIQIRLSAIKSTGDNDEELTRVKKLMQNGLWGCLTKLNQRIIKLTSLQQDN